MAIVAVPLVTALASVALTAAGAGGEMPEDVVGIAYGVALLYLGFHDAAKIKRAGGNPRRLWLKWWALVTPVYLIQRARALRRGWLMLVLFMCAVVANVIVTNPTLFSPTTYWGFGIPKCDERYSINMVKSIFDDMVKKLGSTTTAIDQIRETSFDGKVRVCAGTAHFADKSSTGITYSIDYQENKLHYIARGGQ